MEQEKITSFLNELPEDSETLAFIMNHIGEKYREAIIKEYGVSTVNVLDFSSDSMIMLTNNNERFNEFLKYTALNSLGESEVNIILYKQENVSSTANDNCTLTRKNKM